MIKILNVQNRDYGIKIYYVVNYFIYSSKVKETLFSKIYLLVHEVFKTYLDNKALVYKVKSECNKKFYSSILSHKTLVFRNHYYKK